MPTPLLILVLVSLIPYVLAALGGYVKIKQLGKLDNHHPRIQSNELKGSGARVIAAQSNAWEALAFYSATIFAVYASGVTWSELTVASLVFGATRLAHAVFYITNMAVARSVVTLLGIMSCLYMISLAIF